MGMILVLGPANAWYVDLTVASLANDSKVRYIRWVTCRGFVRSDFAASDRLQVAKMVGCSYSFRLIL